MARAVEAINRHDVAGYEEVSNPVFVLIGGNP
jgi:hypothetical protein